MSSTQNPTTTEEKKEENKPVFLQFDPEHVVTLVSNDGMKFQVDARCMNYSGTIKNMLSGGYKEASDRTIEFDQIEGRVLEKAIQYCYYKQRFDFDPHNRKEFLIEPDSAFLLMMAAQYLEL